MADKAEPECVLACEPFARRLKVGRAGGFATQGSGEATVQEDIEGQLRPTASHQNRSSMWEDRATIDAFQRTLSQVQICT